MKFLRPAPVTLLFLGAGIVQTGCSAQAPEGGQDTTTPAETASQAVTTSDARRIIGFDFEAQSSVATQPGYVHVGPLNEESVEKGMGWEKPNSIDRAHDRDNPNSPFYYQRKDHPLYALVRDGVTVVGSNTFTAKIPNGHYRATLYVGDFSPGESRDNLFASLNGLEVLKGENFPGGVVRAISFALEVKEGEIELWVEGRGSQKYFPVNGLTLEPLATPLPFSVTQTSLPEKPATPENYAQGWARFVESLREDWEQAKTELKREGEWSETWPQQQAAIARTANSRFIFASNSVLLDPLAASAGGTLDLSDYAAILREVGLNGVTDKSSVGGTNLPRNGLEVALMGPGLEHLPANAGEQVDFTHILDRKTGQIKESQGVYTPLSPRTREFFRAAYQPFSKLAANARFMAIDEIRGVWSAGPEMGDYSEPAARAFADWAREHKVKLKADGLPRPARSWDFYEFYRFRQNIVPRFLKTVVAGTPLEKLPVYAGNGYLGPETVNHVAIWGPEAVREGVGLASWDYEGNKGSAEFLAAMEREYGGKVQNWAAFWRSPQRDLVDSVMVATPATRQFSIWHQGSFIQSSDRVNWLKTAYLTTRLAHLTGGAEHKTDIYLYAPDSLAFNDLVGDLPRSEAAHWRETWTALTAANIDFKVTHALKVPKNAIVVYAPVRSVLRPDEAAELTKYIRSGGTLVYASDSMPESPDASPLNALRNALNSANVTKMKALAPPTLRSLAVTKKVAINPASGAPAVRTFIFERENDEYLLLLNSDLKNSAMANLDVAYTDAFSGSDVPKGALKIEAARYRMLRRNK